MENIVLYIQDVVTVLAAIFIYVYLVSSVYPWLTMHLAWKQKRGSRIVRGDRGLLRVKFPEGRGVIYEPDPRVRRYISKYALFAKDGCKYIRCRVDSRIAYIRYDVATFDRRGRLLDVQEVSERLTAEGETAAVRLPTRTAYACVLPRQVDREYVGREMTVCYSPTGIGIFTGLTVVTTVAIAYLLHNSLTYIMTGLTFMEGESFTATLLVSVLLGAICAEWVVLMHYLHSVRTLNR